MSAGWRTESAWGSGGRRFESRRPDLVKGGPVDIYGRGFPKRGAPPLTLLGEAAARVAESFLPLITSLRAGRGEPDAADLPRARRLVRSTRYGATFELNMSAATFHSPSTFTHTTRYLPFCTVPSGNVIDEVP